MIWARLRFVNAQANLEVRFTNRRRPIVDVELDFCRVMLKLSETRMLRLSVGWHHDSLAYNTIITEDILPITVAMFVHDGVVQVLFDAHQLAPGVPRQIRV